MNLIFSVLFTFFLSFEIYAADWSEPTVNEEIKQIAYGYSPATTDGAGQKLALNTSGITRNNTLDEETPAAQRDSVLSGVIVYSIILLVYSVFWYRNSEPTE